MITKDADMIWRPKRIYIPAWQFSGLDYETTTATDIKSVGAGTGNDMAIAEVNSSNVTGITLGANADTVEHLMEVPYDMDLARKVFFKVYWVANNTSGSITWDVLYRPFIVGTTVLDNTALTACDTTPGAQTYAGTAYTVMGTPDAVINANTLALTTELLQLQVKRTANSTITAPIFLGLSIRYTPKKLAGTDGMRHAAKAPTYILGKTYAN